MGLTESTTEIVQLNACPESAELSTSVACFARSHLSSAAIVPALDPSEIG